MVKGLPVLILQTQELVQDVIVEASDTSSIDTCSFSLEIEHLSDEPAFPVKSSVEVRAELAKSGFESGEHAQREGTVGRNALVAADDLGRVPAVFFGKQV